MSPSVPGTSCQAVLRRHVTAYLNPGQAQSSGIVAACSPALGGSETGLGPDGYNRRQWPCPSGDICPANTLSLVGRLAALSRQENPVFVAPRCCRRVVLFGLLVVLALVALSVGLRMGRAAERPKLLPKKTLAYVRIADSRELVESFMKTSVGRLSQDEKIKPLIMHLYGSVTQAFAQVQDQIGVSLGEILSIPQGEVCGAIIGRERGRTGVRGLGRRRRKDADRAQTAGTRRAGSGPQRWHTNAPKRWTA